MNRIVIKTSLALDAPLLSLSLPDVNTHNNLSGLMCRLKGYYETKSLSYCLQVVVFIMLPINVDLSNRLALVYLILMQQR